jgi:hypothetical protein
MLSKIAAQKEAEHERQAALESVARLKTSRAAGLALASKSARAELWSVPQHPTSRSVEDSPDCVVAHAEEETEVIPLGEYSARSPVDRNLPRHKVGAWMVMEGRGNDRGEGFVVGHGLQKCGVRA